MTGTPDAVVEAAAEAIYTHQRNDLHGDPMWLDVEPQFQEMYRDEARAALAAAEGPWREHIATQIEAERDEVAKGTGSNSIAKTGGRLWGLNRASRIVRGSEPGDEFQDSED